MTAVSFFYRVSNTLQHSLTASREVLIKLKAYMETTISRADEK